MEIYVSSSWCELDSSMTPHHESMPHQTFCWCEVNNRTVPHQSHPTISRSASTCRSGSRANRRLADRHRPADRVGPKPRICRSFADQVQAEDPRISRSGSTDYDHPIGLQGPTDTRPTRNRVRDDEMTMTQGTEANSKGAVGTAQREFGRLKRKRRQRIRRRRLNLTLTYHLLVHSFTHTSLHI